LILIYSDVTGRRFATVVKARLPEDQLITQDTLVTSYDSGNLATFPRQVIERP
jgi:hypothetical protein